MVSIGRSRLPPESIRWCASLGISSTSETALSRMMRLTAAHVLGDEVQQRLQGRLARLLEWDDDSHVCFLGSVCTAL